MYDRMQELYRFSHCSEPFFSHMEFCKNQEMFDERLTKLFERFALFIRRKRNRILQIDSKSARGFLPGPARKCRSLLF